MITSGVVAAGGGPMLAMGSGGSDFGAIGLLFFLSGFLFYGFMYLKYRNTDKRHMHARETESTIDNVRAADDFLRRRTQQRNATIKGANARHVEGAQNSNVGTGLLSGILDSSGASRSVGRMISPFDHR